LPFFEISLKLRIFSTHIGLFEEITLGIIRNKFGPHLATFSHLWATQTHFRVGRHANKEKHFNNFNHRIPLTKQMQLLENPKKSKNRFHLLNQPFPQLETEIRASTDVHCAKNPSVSRG
jgi:hypothetical protein